MAKSIVSLAKKVMLKANAVVPKYQSNVFLEGLNGLSKKPSEIIFCEECKSAAKEKRNARLV
ncbi:hypothetical protein LJC59_00110 [Desulfovibrio sp. OttesenSCG-928-A18]|nr:hypothetical protein [Desulfovibrio sp. OttesenSCG-928-A18]